MSFNKNSQKENRFDFYYAKISRFPFLFYSPEGFRTGFIVPGHSENGGEPTNEPQTRVTTFDDVIRIMVSYDMGWSTRGAGRQYDSLNGYGAIIGHFSGQVLDYGTCNRKCKKCDLNGNSLDHDCRRNFYGSAKAMEPHVGKNLVVESEILKSHNVEVGVLIGDDDSSTIAACRSASNHDIIKQSDRNHAGGGVKKQLYQLEKGCKELNTERINYLHRCFTYALAQNQGESKAMAAAIRSIPHHTFNDHSICGTWCGYLKNKENYEHSTVPDGFTDVNLLTALKTVFYKLAENAEKFSLGTSSNSNESLNATMASKTPKSRCYSLSASADYRFACSVGQKNLGQTYIQEITDKVQLSPGRHHQKHIARVDKRLLRRREYTKTREFKIRRNLNKKIRSGLRHLRENNEGTTYESNCGLFRQSAVPDEEQQNVECEFNDVTHAFIFFDLETSSTRRDCDILQIAALCGTNEFNIYIKPRQPISPSATAVNGLINSNGTLLLHGKILDTVSLKVAVQKFMEWMENLEKDRILVAHNLIFDGPRLFNAVKKYGFEARFSNLVSGFLDTLPLIRTITGKRGKGECTLSGLAKSQNITVAGAHNAVVDCQMLSKVLHALKITSEILSSNIEFYDTQITKWNGCDQTESNLNALKPLEKVLGPSVRKKLASACITILNPQNIYTTLGAEGIGNFFKEQAKKNVISSLQKKTVQKIIDFLADKTT